jgi:hypothetical protein
MSATAPSKRRRFRNYYRSGNFGPMHLRRGRAGALAATNKAVAMGQTVGATATAGVLSAKLTWTPKAYANHYLIEQSANGTTGWAEVAKVNGNASSYIVRGLTAAVALFWRISAVNGANVAGAVSTNVTATPTA